MSKSGFNFLHPVCADSWPYMCRQFVASVYGQPLVVSIHDNFLSLVLTSLECIVTTNNSNLEKPALHLKGFFLTLYGTKCVGRIVTKSMSYFLHLCDCSLPYCAILEAWNWFVAGQHLNASHTVYILPDDSWYSGIALSFGIRSKSVTVEE